MRLLLLLLLVGPAVAQTREGRGRVSRIGRAPPTGVPPLFEFLPSSGAGVATAADLCASLPAADRVGSWWCLNGDSTMAAGSAITLAPVGSPTVGTWPVCNSGTDCTAKTQTFLNGTASQYFSTAGNVAAPIGSFTVCVLYTTDGQGDDIINYGDGAGDYTFLLEDNGTTGITVYCDGVGGACGAGPTSYVDVPGLEQFQCAIFEAGVSTRTHGWSAGGHISNSTGAHVRTQVDQTARKWSVGRSFAGTAPYCTGGRIRGAFMTEKVLTVDQMRTIGAAVTPGMNYLNTLIASPVGSKGEQLTFTRAVSPRTCCQTDDVTGTLCTVLGPGVPCLSGGYLKVFEERTNRQLRACAINVAPWADFTAGGAAAPTLNAANVATPDPLGLPAAEDYTFPATSAVQASTRLGNAGVAACTGVSCANSIKVYGVGNSGTIDVCAVGATVSCANCTVTSGAWTYCFKVANLAGNPAIAIGNASLYNGGVARDAIRVLVSSAQTEVGAWPSPFICTEGTTVTRVVERPSFVYPTGMASGGSLAVTVQSKAATHGVVESGATDARFAYVNAGSTYNYDGTTNAGPVTADTVTAPVRIFSFWSGSSKTIGVGGTTASSAFDGAIGGSPLAVGGGGFGSGPVNGGVKQLCYDPNTLRCR